MVSGAHVCVMSACVSVCMVNCRWSRLVIDSQRLDSDGEDS